MSAREAVERLDIRRLLQRIGASSPTIWRWTKAGKFPLPEYLGEKRVWRLDEIERWEAEQLARPPSARRANRNLRGGNAQGVAP